MRFRADKPIFQQIVEYTEDQIIRGELGADQRISAVRDLAIALEVNPNTVVRSFTALEESGVIFKKRGLGYFVSADARSKIIERRRRVFLEVELPEIVRTMHLLGIEPAAVKQEFSSYRDQLDHPYKLPKEDR